MLLISLKAQYLHRMWPRTICTNRGSIQGNSSAHDIILKTAKFTLHSPLVFFDLGTTGFGNEAVITQIAAVQKDQKCSQYLLPPRAITVCAKDVTGLSVSGFGGSQRNGALVLNGNVVRSVSIDTALSILPTFVLRYVPLFYATYLCSTPPTFVLRYLPLFFVCSHCHCAVHQFLWHIIVPPSIAMT